MANDSVIVRIDGDDKGFKKALSGIEKTAVKSLGVVVKGIGVTSAGISALAGLAIKSFKDYEQLVGGIDTLFESSSKKVQQNAAKAYKTAGMSANDYMQMTMSFSASLKQSFEDTAEGIDKAADVADMAISDMSDNSNKMGTDMELIKNAYQGFAKQNYTMLDNLKLGYGGTKTEMERLLADAQKLSGVKYNINNLADVYNAIHVIQTELGITGTTAKEAASTIEGSVNMMKASYSNLMTGLADDNADFDKLLDEFIDSILVVGDNILPRIKTTIEGIGEFVSKAAAELLPEVAELLIDTLPSLLSSVGKLAEGMGDALIDCFDQVAENAPEIVDAAVEVVESFVEGLVKATPKLLDAAGDMIASLADALGDAVPILKPVTSIVEVLGGNLKTVARVALAAVSAFKAFTIIQTVTAAVKGLVATYQTANLQLGLYTAQLGVSKIANLADLAALSAKEIVVGVLTGKIGLATAAQYLWNAAMSANPIGLVITLVAALSTGIGVLIATQNKEKTQLQLLAEESQRATEKAREQAEAYDKLKESQEEQISSDLAQISNLKLLSDELEGLANANGRVDESNQKRASFILNELNEAMGTEYKLVDGQIQKYADLCTSIDTYLQKKQAQVFLDAAEERYNTAITSISEARKQSQNDLYNMNLLLAESQEKLGDSSLTLGDILTYTSQDVNNLTEAEQKKRWVTEGLLVSLGETGKALIEAGNSYNTNADNVATWSQDISDYSAAVEASLAGNINEVIAILDKGNNSVKTSTQIMAEQSKLTKEEVGENYALAVAGVEAAFLAYEKNANSANKQALLSAIEYASNLRKAYEDAGGAIVDGQVEGMDGKKIELSTKALEIMQATASACGESNVDFVASGKDAVAGIIAGLEDPESKRKLYNAGYACGLIELQGHDDATGRNSPAKEFIYSAKDSVRGVVLGFNKGKKAVYNSGYDLAKEGVEGYNDGQDAHSPAKEYVKASKNSVDGLIKGFEDNSDKLYKTLDDINDEMLHGQDVSNENLLESEQAYLDEALKREKDKNKTSKEIAEEMADWKLEKLKETAEAERKVLEEEKKSHIDYLNERAGAYYDALEDIADAQDEFNKKLNNDATLYTEKKIVFKGLGENGQDFEFKEFNLADLSEEAQKAEEYTNKLLAVKARGGVPDEFFSELRDMSIEEGSLFAEALLKASDEEFRAYMEDWEKLRDDNEFRSKEIFGDDVSKLKEEFDEEWESVPEEFFDLGEDALEKFGEGFMNQLSGLMSEIRRNIESSMSVLSVSYGTPGADSGRSIINTWNPTYIINPSPKETTSQALMSTRAYDEVERQRKQ